MTQLCICYSHVAPNSKHHCKKFFFFYSPRREREKETERGGKQVVLLTQEDRTLNGEFIGNKKQFFIENKKV